MNGNRDLYEVLGVLPDAEPVVITAAYRALAARYHPDRWSGPPEVAHERMSQINGAYEVLGDPTKRREYDASRKKSGTAFNDPGEEATAAFDQALQEVEARWEIAVSVFPELHAMRASLSKTSHQLAFAFVTMVLETKSFGEARALAESLEAAFLERYFGSNKEILSFARELIALGLRDAVKRLNRLVDVLGSDAAPERVIATVVRDFGVDKEREKVYGFKEMEAKRHAEAHRRRIIRERFSKEPFVDVAIELAGLMGFKVRTEGGSLFRLPTYIVERQGELVARFASGPELVQWVQESAAGEDAL